MAKELEYNGNTAIEKVREKLNEHHNGPYLTLISNTRIQEFRNPSILKMGDLESSLSLLDISSIYIVPKEEDYNEVGYDAKLDGDNGDKTRTISVCLGGPLSKIQTIVAGNGKLIPRIKNFLWLK